MSAPRAEVVEALKARLGAKDFPLGIEVAPETLLEAARALRDAHGYRYYVLATATCREKSFEVVHGVRNLDTGDTLFLKTTVLEEAAEVDSLVPLYPGADWYEREIYDLFGIVFRGHPDLRRILMPDEYEGHPLLKEFPMDAPWGYRPLTRPESA